MHAYMLMNLNMARRFNYMHAHTLMTLMLDCAHGIRI